MPVTHGVTSSSLVRTALRFLMQTKRNKHVGALVQLVRIHACHAWGHEFESRTHRQRSLQNQTIGALVQLVRIHACHAWGHEFESRTHRQRSLQNQTIGALVQLVRIHACHAWGHEFESRTHRQLRGASVMKLLFLCPKLLFPRILRLTR